MKIVKPVYDYLKHKKMLGREKNTLKAYGYDLKLFWEFLEYKEYDYKNISPMDISEFIEYLRESEHDEGIEYMYKESKRMGKTINRILSTVHGFYKYLALIQNVDNPIMMEEVNRPSNMYKNLLYHIKNSNKVNKSIFKVKERGHRVKLINDSEMNEILSTLNNWRDKLIYKILFLTGARISEVLNLKIEDIPRVKADTSMISVIEDIKSKGKYRSLYIPIDLLDELDDYILEERYNIDTDHSYLFVSQHKRYLGKPLSYNAAYQKLRQVRKQANIYFTFHDLRHTFITNLIEMGMDISIAKIIAGHKHISTTQKYTHLSDKYVKESLEKYWKGSSLLNGDKNEK